jgi:hypothetical protein
MDVQMLNRGYTLFTPITEQAKQQEWETICTTARSNGFPLQIIDSSRNKTLRT